MSELSLPVDGALVEAIAARAAELVAERFGREIKSPWMTRPQAAKYLGWPLSRLEKRRDVPHVKDEGRVFYHREQVDAFLLEQGESLGMMSAK
jgi:hypothetical protein